MPLPPASTARSLALSLALAAIATPALAYIGPGAGFALGGSLLFALAGILLAILGVLTWPFRLLARSIRHRRVRRRRKTRRVVLLGLAGLPPALLRDRLAAGEMPRLAALIGTEGVQDLATTRPALSGVAWRSLATGLDAGGHGWFGHGETGSEHGRRCWSVLAEHGVETTVLEVPGATPDPAYRGRMLARHRWVEGRATVFAPPGTNAAFGTDIHVQVLTEDDRGDWCGTLVGPPGHAVDPLPIRCRVDADHHQARFKVADQDVVLDGDEASPWLRVSFREGRRSVPGIVRARVLDWSPFSLLLTPVEPDPTRPAHPLGRPSLYPVMLGKVFGAFGTGDHGRALAGLVNSSAGATARRDLVLDRHRAQVARWAHALDRQNSGAVLGVFDLPDALLRGTAEPDQVASDLARHLDDLIGKTHDNLGKDDTLLVVSELGLGSFQRTLDLNAWLRDQGYLRLEDDPDRDPLPVPDPAARIDWARTRVQARGAAGLRFNLVGREPGGVVPVGEVPALTAELTARLTSLEDPAGGRPVVAVQAVRDCVAGAYLDGAPDLLLDLDPRWRLVPDQATDQVGTDVFGAADGAARHVDGADPDRSAGVLISNRPLGGAAPRVVDLAPTILDLCGVPVPDACQGRSLLDGRS